MGQVGDREVCERGRVDWEGEGTPHSPPVTAGDVVPNAASPTSVVDDDAVPHRALVVHPTAELGGIPVLSGVLAGGVPISVIPQEHWLQSGVDKSRSCKSFSSSSRVSTSPCRR